MAFWCALKRTIIITKDLTMERDKTLSHPMWSSLPPLIMRRKKGMLQARKVPVMIAITRVILLVVARLRRE